LPADSAPQASNAKPGGPAQRPAAGPVVPLTAMQAAPEELIGGGRAGGSAGDSRVLSKGEAAAAPSGRADDFSWPRGSARKTQSPDSDAAAALAAPEPTPDDAAAKAAQPPSGPRTSTAESGAANADSEPKPATKRRPRRPNPNAQQPFIFPNFFR
jgi:hypothetical protein